VTPPNSFCRRRAPASDDQDTCQMVTGPSNVDIDHMVRRPRLQPSPVQPGRLGRLDRRRSRLPRHPRRSPHQPSPTRHHHALRERMHGDRRPVARPVHQPDGERPLLCRYRPRSPPSATPTARARGRGTAPRNALTTMTSPTPTIFSPLPSPSTNPRQPRSRSVEAALLGRLVPLRHRLGHHREEMEPHRSSDRYDALASMLATC
jgi:hypothetical protein